jgi:hypothetical protein
MNPKGQLILNTFQLIREFWLVKGKDAINVIACLSEYDIRVVVMLSLN